MVLEVLDASNGRIVLDKVYLNGLHSLRRLSLRNTEQTAILVKLDSTLGDQLSFQLDNENLPDLPTPLQHLATNTAAYASSAIASRNATNEMFNRVNLIEELSIPPLETVSIVLLFAPDPPSKQSKRLSAGAGSDSGSSATTPSFAPGSADYFAIRGHEDVHVLQKMDGEIYFTVESPGQSDAHPKQSVVIKLSASVCDSVLDTDIHDGGISFEDCIVGGTYSKYFTVRNRSEIDLHWSFELLDAEEAAEWIEFMDADTLRPLDQECIPAFGSRRIRMVFRPTRPSKISQHLYIENVYNPDNTIEVPLHASVTSMHKEETLFLMSGSSIDFGDCVAGTWTRQVLVLKNVSSSLLEAHFKSIDPGDVRFQLQIDDDDDAPDGGITATTPTTMTPGTTTPSDALPWGSNGILSELSRAPTQPLTLEAVDSVTSPMEFPSSPPMQQAKSFGQMLDAVSTDREPRTLDSASRATSRSSSTHRPEEGSFDLDDARSVSTGSATTEGISNTARKSEPRKTRMSREDHVTQIEELLMRPGQSYRIAVSYRPKAVDVNLDSKAGTLVKKSFRLVIDYGLPASRGTSAPRESKTIHCRTRTCTSVISVSPSVIDFGETEVGTLQSMPLTIINESDMTAHVDMRFISKIINMYRNEIRIPPRQSLEVKVDIYPRKINPDYKKQITVVNLLNRANDQIVEVRSNNQDRTGITLHSLLYRILTPTGANFIDFGNLILNSATIRTFTIENLTDKKLVIDLTSTSPDEIVPYVKGEEDVDGEELDKDSELPANSSSSSSLSSLGSSLGSARSEKDKLQMQPLSMLRPPNPAELKEKVLESIVGNDRDILSRRMACENSENASTFHIEPEESAPVPIKSSSGNHAVVSAAKENQSSRDKLPSLPLKQKPARKNSTQQQQQNEELGGTDYLDLASSVQVGGDGRINSSPPKQPKSRQDSTEKSVPGRLTLNGDALRKVKNGQRSPVGTIRKWPPVPDESGCVSNAMPPLTGKQPSFRHHLIADFPDVSRLSLDQFLLAMEQHSTLKIGGRNEPLPSPPLKNTSNAVNMEEKYVRSVMSFQRELAALIEAEAIVPVSRVVLGPRQDRKVIIVSRPLSSMRPHVQGLPRKQDARIFLRLTEFDADILNAAMTTSAQPIVSKPEAIPVRKLMLRATMIRSIMELSQPHINFGYVDRSDRRTKTMLVQNRSEAPLLIAVRKSGSVASSDLLLAHGAHFVIPGFGKKEVEFVFSPSLSGPFQEKMVVENVRDRENDQTVLVKAHVRKVHTFYVDSGLEVDFGNLSMGLQATVATSKSSHIIISNTSKINRVYEVHVESEELLFDLHGTALAQSHYLAVECLIEEALSSGGARDTLLTKVEEEEVEHLEQKLKIAKRKGKDDKIKKLETRLGELGVGDGSGSVQASPVEPPVESSPELDRSAAKGSAKHKFRRLGSSSVTFGLDAGQVKRLTVALRPQLCVKMQGQQATMGRATVLADGCPQIVSRLVLHEHRNKDDAREVQLRIKVRLDGDTVNNEGSYEGTLSSNAFSLRPGILDSQGQ